jgi:hypothetical protein
VQTAYVMSFITVLAMTSLDPKDIAEKLLLTPIELRVVTPHERPLLIYVLRGERLKMSLINQSTVCTTIDYYC